MRRGWFRLWVLATAVGVPATALWIGASDSRFWSNYNSSWISTCDRVEASSKPPFPSMEKCLHAFRADEGMYQQMGTTPARYWSEMVGLTFLADLLITGLLVGAFLAIRWVVRGFRANPGSANS